MQMCIDGVESWKGYQVMIRLRSELFLKGAFQKLHSRKAGPYKVLKHLGHNAYLKLPKELCVIIPILMWTIIVLIMESMKTQKNSRLFQDFLKCQQQVILLKISQMKRLSPQGMEHSRNFLPSGKGSLSEEIFRLLLLILNVEVQNSLSDIKPLLLRDKFC